MGAILYSAQLYQSLLQHWFLLTMIGGYGNGPHLQAFVCISEKKYH